MTHPEFKVRGEFFSYSLDFAFSEHTVGRVGGDFPPYRDQQAGKLPDGGLDTPFAAAQGYSTTSSELNLG
jgi:hypothetical protein